MASYILRDIDRELFERAKIKAKAESKGLKAVIESLIAAWLDERKPLVLMDGCAPADYRGFPPTSGFKVSDGQS